MTTIIPPTVPSYDGTFLPLRKGESELRAALSELMLASALALADIARANPTWNAEGTAKQSEERLRKALELGREALS